MFAIMKGRRIDLSSEPRIVSRQFTLEVSWPAT